MAFALFQSEHYEPLRLQKTEVDRPRFSTICSSSGKRIKVDEKRTPSRSDLEGVFNCRLIAIAMRFHRVRFTANGIES